MSVRLVRDGKLYTNCISPPYLVEYLKYPAPVVISRRILEQDITITLLANGEVFLSTDGNCIGYPSITGHTKMNIDYPVIDIDCCFDQIHVLSSEGKISIHSTKEFIANIEDSIMAIEFIVDYFHILGSDGKVYRRQGTSLTQIHNDLHIYSYWLKGGCYAILYPDRKLSIHGDFIRILPVACRIVMSFSLSMNTLFVLDDKGDLYKINSEETRFLLSGIKDFNEVVGLIYILGKDNKFRMAKITDQDLKFNEINV